MVELEKKLKAKKIRKMQITRAGTRAPQTVWKTVSLIWTCLKCVEKVFVLKMEITRFITRSAQTVSPSVSWSENFFCWTDALHGLIHGLPRPCPKPCAILEKFGWFVDYTVDYTGYTNRVQSRVLALDGPNGLHGQTHGLSKPCVKPCVVKLWPKHNFSSWFDLVSNSLTL